MRLEIIDILIGLLEEWTPNPRITQISYDNGEGGYIILTLNVEIDDCVEGKTSLIPCSYMIDANTGKPVCFKYKGHYINMDHVGFDRLYDENKPTEYTFFSIGEHVYDDEDDYYAMGIIGKNGEIYYEFPKYPVENFMYLGVEPNLIEHKYLVIYEYELPRWDEKKNYKKYYGLFDISQKKIVIQPMFEKIYEENGQIYTELRKNIFLTDKKKYVRNIKKGNALMSSSIHSEEIYNCYQCPIIIDTINDCKDIDDYVFRVGEYAGYTLSEVNREFPNKLLDMVKDSILHVMYYQEKDADKNEIDEFLLKLSSWSDCHLHYKDIKSIDDKMEVFDSTLFNSTFRFEGWSIEEIISTDYTYLLRLVRYRKIYIYLDVLSKLKSKYSPKSRMFSRIEKIENEMNDYDGEIESARNRAMAEDDNNFYNEEFWYREAFGDEPDAYWNID